MKALCPQREASDKIKRKQNQQTHKENRKNSFNKPVLSHAFLPARLHSGFCFYSLLRLSGVSQTPRCRVGGGVRGEKLQETALAPLVFSSSQWTLLFPLVVRTSVFISEAISTKAGANL